MVVIKQQKGTLIVFVVFLLFVRIGAEFEFAQIGTRPRTRRAHSTGSPRVHLAATCAYMYIKSARILLVHHKAEVDLHANNKPR